MPPNRKPKKDYSDAQPELAGRGSLIVSVQARNDSQQEVVDLWPRSRVMFLIGPAGGGKTHIALALALSELLRRPASDRPKLMLSRPMVTVNEDIGFLPGDVTEKFGPWCGPFYDVFSQITFAKWEQLVGELDVELVPVGLLRGRTIRNGVLVVDEAQGLDAAQIKCILTRLGHGSRIILSGDPEQSDRFTVKQSPLLDAAKKLGGLDTVSVVRFTEKDQVRDQLVSDILRLL